LAGLPPGPGKPQQFPAPPYGDAASDNSMVRGNQVYWFLPEGYLLETSITRYNGNKTALGSGQGRQLGAFD